jgi:hypothetical protein
VSSSVLCFLEEISWIAAVSTGGDYYMICIASMAGADGVGSFASVGYICIDRYYYTHKRIFFMEHLVPGAPVSMPL